MLKQSVLILAFVSLLTAATSETRPKPPTPTMGDMNHRQAGCKVPEFLVSIPPMMEKDYVECVNTKTRPSDMLKQQISEEAELISVEPAPRFYTRVYKVTYKLKGKTEAMICNDKMTYCLDDKPIVSRER